MNKKFRPIKDKICVKIGPKEITTKSGLIIEVDSTGPMQEAVIVSCGPDVKEVSKGQRIMYRRFSGIELEPNYFVIIESDIFGYFN